MQLSPGTRLGPYEIVGAIGAGGMGEVFRARDTKLDRDVAVKVLPELFADDPERLARFEREAKTLAALNHPNIAHVHGVIEHPAALVMEFVDGEDLSQRIERGPIPLDEAVPFARQIAEALEAAHEHGIVHRDLKPANIKIAADGTVKVLDFGLAKALDSAAATDVANSPTLTMRATQAGVILGTAAYMAPEQARGKTVDRRADIWAFGAVLYEMLTGRRAFEGDTVSDLIASVIKERVPLEQLPADVPPAVRTLIARCLEKDQKLRLRDIGEARVLLSQPIVEQKAPAGMVMPGGAPPSRATSRLFIVLTVLLATGLLAALTLLWQRSTAPPGIARFDVLPPDGTEVNVVARPSVSVSPDGSIVVFAATTNGVSHLYVRRRDAVEVRQLAGTDGASEPVFSPDGAWIAFIAGNQLAKVPLDGPVAPITKVNDVRGLAWLDRSSLIYSPDATAGLMRISADGGAPESVTTPDANKGQRSHRWPCVLPGGNAVLYTVGQTNSPDDYDASAIEAVTLATGERRTVLQGASMASYVATGHLLFTRGGALHAVPFDPGRLQVTGAAVPVLQGVMGDRTTGAAHFSVGSEGTLAYIPGTSRGALRVMLWVDAEGKTRPVDLAPAQHNDLRISPDGTRVAFVQGTSGIVADVWVLDLQRKSLTRLTFDGTNSTPVWSADGRTIYYASIEPSGRKTTFLRKPADGSRDAEPVGAIEWRGYFKEVLANGTAAIVETVRTAPKADILRIPLTPGKADIIAPTALVATQADEYASDVSPDGRWFAYNSDESGRYDVWVRDLSGAGGRWQISTAGGEEPHWSPDGRRLYYRYDDGLYGVPIDTRGGFSAGTPQLLFRGVYNLRSDTGLSYDVDPKTGGFLMMRPAVDQKSRNTIRVVLNWFDELKSKFPR